MAQYPFSIEAMAEYALLLRWPLENKGCLAEIQQLQQALSQQPWLVDVVASSHSIALIGAHDDYYLNEKLQQWLQQHVLSELDPVSTRCHTLPVCYHPSLGFDIAALCEALKLSEQELVQAHLDSRFVVTSTAFRPGFAYLSGLDNRLRLPRRSEPRLEVPAGSVAIAENYSAIYPQASPAGWHIIGACPLPMLDLNDPEPCRLAVGDQVRFESISLEQYQQWEANHD